MLKKLCKPDIVEVLRWSQMRAYVVVDSLNFIAKSELCFPADKRMIALRDFVLLMLMKQKEPVSIHTLIEKTKSNLQELTPILANLANRVLVAKGLVFVAHYELKKSAIDDKLQLDFKDVQRSITQDWKSLES
jgi:hypothetical protein